MTDRRSSDGQATQGISPTDPSRTGGTVTVRKPTPEDGSAVHALIAACPPLDRNSLYFDLIQCSHFADTCALAETNGAGQGGDERAPIGFVSGHIVPSTPDTLFIWQVAIDTSARGMGLAARLILEIAARPECRQVRKIVATITPDNAASWALFKGVAAKLSTPYAVEDHFDKDRHFHGQHDSEDAIIIGTFADDAAAHALARLTKPKELTQ